MQGELSSALLVQERARFLVSTALTGGVLAAMLVVSPASAACVTTGNQTVCNPLDANLTVNAAGPNLSTTIDVLTANPGFLITANGAPTPSAGTMTVTVGSGVNLVSGAGQHGILGNGNGDTLVVNVVGTVTGAGGAGLALNSGPGVNGVFVAANNSITGLVGDGISVNNVGTGNVGITGGGSITGTSPNLGININNTNAGAVNTDIRQTGVITGGSGGGIQVQHIGSGNIIIGTNDQSIRQVIASGGTGISAQTNGVGTISVVTGGSIGGGVANGIQTTADAGATTVIAGGNITATADGISVNSNAGRIDVVNRGAVTVGGNGIFGNATTGAVNLTNQGAITSTGGPGANLNSTTGALTLINEASRSIQGTAGVRLTATGAANLMVENDGSIRGTTAGGVTASSAGGAVTVENNATIQGATTGISATTTAAGVVNVLNSGAVAGGTGRGVFAETVNGNLYVGNDAAGLITSTSGGGVLANSTTGNIRLDNAGVIDGGSASTGVTMTSAGGSLFVQNERLIAGNTHGLQMTSAGAGPITYIGAGSVNGGIGIEATQGPAGTGAIFIGGTGNVTGTTGAGVVALINNAGNAANIDITQAGAITGANGGITATTIGTGNITIAGVGAVAGGAGNGITATAAGGNVTVAPAFTVTGGLTGIAATTSGAGSVAITSAPGRTISGGVDGVTAATTGVGNITVVNGPSTIRGTGGRGVVTNATSGRTDVANSGSIIGGAGVGVQSIATSGSIRVDNFAGALIQGATIGIQTQTTGGPATVTNAAGASIVAPVIFSNAGGVATFNNAGVVDGGITSAAAATSTTINNTGTWQISAAGTFALAGANDTIRNDALFNVPTIGSNVTFTGLEGFTNGSGALVNVANGATLSLAGSNFLNSSRIDIGAGASLVVGAMTNNSVINMGAGATLQGTTNTLNNAGVINVGANGIITDAGAVNNLGGAQINFANGGTITSGTSAISNAGQINLGAGNLAMNGNVTNTGLINMVNGVTGQAVNVNGTYTGGGVLGIDLNLATRASDQLVVTGAGAGTTAILVNRVGGATVDGAPITIVQGANGASYVIGGTTLAAGQSVIIDDTGILQQTAVNNGGSLQIVSGIDLNAIGGFSSAVSSVLSSLNSFTEPASAFVTGPGNAAANQVSFGVPWIRLRGGEFDIKSATTFQNGRVSNKINTNFQGYQAGLDVGVYNINNTGWNVIIGAHGGMSTASAGNGDSSVSMEQPFGGAYLVIKNNAFTFDAMIRRDFVDMKVSSTSGGFGKTRLTAEGWSGILSAQYRIAVTDTITITPSAAFLFSKLDVGSLTTAGVTTRWGALDSMIGRAGVDVSTIYQLSSQTFLVPFVNASVWHEFAGDVRATSGAGVNSFASSTTRVGTYGQVGVGTAITSPSQGFTGFVRGDLRFGDKISGYALNGGVRWQF